MAKFKNNVSSWLWFIPKPALMCDETFGLHRLTTFDALSQRNLSFVYVKFRSQDGILCQANNQALRHISYVIFHPKLRHNTNTKPTMNKVDGLSMLAIYAVSICQMMCGKWRNFVCATFAHITSHLNRIGVVRLQLCPATNIGGILL